MKTTEKILFLFTPPFLATTTLLLGITAVMHMQLWGIIFNFAALPFLIEKVPLSRSRYLLYNARDKNLKEIDETLKQLKHDRTNLELLHRLNQLLAEGRLLDERAGYKPRRSTGH